MEKKTLYIYFILIVVLKVSAEYGVLRIKKKTKLVPSVDVKFCFTYNRLFHRLPHSEQAAEWVSFEDFFPSYLCDERDLPAKNLHQSIVLGARGACMFVQKAELAQAHNASTLLIINDTKVIPGANSSDDYHNINITVGILQSQYYQKIREMWSLNISGQVYHFNPPAGYIDYNLILIWLIAMVTIVSGSYWSGIVKFEELTKERIKKTKSSLCRGEEEGDAPNTSINSQKSKADDDTVDISMKYIVVLFVFMCAMIVLMYYFYHYVVYVFIAMFCIASSAGLYTCLLPIYERLVKFELRLSCKSEVCMVRRIVLALFCIGVAVWWAVERNTSYAWVLQDILGIAFAINILKTLRLSNLMGCTLLLGLLLCYDVFFVFITPLFTKNGESIMVDIATGHGAGDGGSGDGTSTNMVGSASTAEMLPMVFKVPKLSPTPVTVCPVAGMPYSLLGFGDVIVPGFLLSYCHAFDLYYSTRRIYFVCTSIAYGAGLVITFVVLAVMKSGQPALLYLVPSTLLTVLFVGLIKKDIKKLWRGFPKPIKKNKENQPINCSETRDPETVIDGGQQSDHQYGGTKDDQVTADTDQSSFKNAQKSRLDEESEHGSSAEDTDQLLK